MQNLLQSLPLCHGADVRGILCSGLEAPSSHDIRVALAVACAWLAPLGS